jgi:hypothetical protein
MRVRGLVGGSGWLAGDDVEVVDYGDAAQVEEVLPGWPEVCGSLSAAS